MSEHQHKPDHPPRAHAEGERAMRAKVYVSSVEKYEHSEKLNFHAVAANSYGGDGLDENNTYAKYSPQADFHITVNNPALLGKFAPGDRFYVDFVAAPK